MNGPDRIDWRFNLAEKQKLQRYMVSAQLGAAQSTTCGCVGPQNGEPVCPCAMRSVKIVDGRYVQVIDLGPAK